MVINTDTENNKIEFLGKTNIKNFKKHEFYINDTINKHIIYFGDDGKEKITNNLYLDSVQVLDNDTIFCFKGGEEILVTCDNTFTDDISALNKYLYFDTDYNIYTPDKVIVNTRILEFLSVIIHDFASELDPEFVVDDGTPTEPESEPVESEPTE